MDVSIIIVNYNTKNLLADCLNSIYEQTKDISFEVIVSDNGSKDGSIEMLKADFPQVILIENNANLGFGAANNRGLAIAKGKYIFYLNSDTILLNNAVKIFFDYWEENGEKENIGALGANLLNRNNEIIHSYGSFMKYGIELKNSLKALRATSIYTILSIFSKRFPPLDIQDDRTQKYVGDVDYITGADLFLKNDDLALFDEHYFMYCEETDLQLKMAKAEKKRSLIDKPQIIHLSGGGNKKLSDKVRSLASFSSINFNISRIYYFKKNGSSNFKTNFLRIITLLTWLNPLILRVTRKYIPTLLKI